MKKLVIVLFSCCFTTSLFGQGLHFSQYYNAPMLINPANTGLIEDYDWRAGVNYRNQGATIPIPYNTSSVFADAALLNDFAQKKVLLLRADWTRYDPAITKALNELGRNGLPVYAWYASGQPVRLLSELITVKEIQSYLSQLKSSPIKS